MNGTTDAAHVPVQLIALPIDRLAYADWNYKEDDAFKLEKLKNNLKLHGQVENLCVRELPTGFYEVVNGNHRLTAFKELQWTAAVWCYNFGVISDALAKRLAVELNETRFIANLTKLADVMDEVMAGFAREDLLATLPFTEPELETFAQMKDFDWNKEDEGKRKGAMLEGDRVILEFKLTPDQARVINEALIRLVMELQIEGEYRMSRALELIAADSLNTPLESFK